MTTIIFRPPVFASFILLTVPACANSSPGSTAADASATSAGVDLGPSSRVPTTQVAMAGGGHEGRSAGNTKSEPAGKVQLVHNDGSDAHATGTVNSVDPAQHKINVSHQPIPSLGWPAMTMEFPVAPSVSLNGIKPGSRVNFSLEKGKDGMYQVQSVQPTAAGK
jgi:Cu(I)/Ag(I) efflux system periplasmic protein CusF